MHWSAWWLTFWGKVALPIYFSKAHKFGFFVNSQAESIPRVCLSCKQLALGKFTDQKSSGAKNAVSFTVKQLDCCVLNQNR